MKKRLVWIDILRIIGIIGVLFMHIVGNTINTYGNLNDNAKFLYVFLGHLFEFSIPLFVMISGMMFLNKEKLTYKEMIKKYCLKILLTIIIIGSGMIILEEIFTTKSISANIIETIFYRLITGEIWAHMWYLYMIIGLYLITPALILITKNIDKKDYQILLIILFIMTVFNNSINNFFDINMSINMLGISGYIFYFLYGYYLFKYEINNKYILINYLLSIVSIIYIYYHVSNNTNLDHLFNYVSVIPFIIASSTILLFKNRGNNLKYSNLINSIGICSYGIYVFHQLFINIIYKVIKFKFIISYPYIGIILYILIIFIITYIFVYLIKKIKIVDRYLI